MASTSSSARAPGTRAACSKPRTASPGSAGTPPASPSMRMGRAWRTSTISIAPTLDSPDTGGMAGALPDGEPVPADGALPETALATLGQRPFGLYVHVPFCVTRCGYCDFNTYTDLGGLQATYAQAAVEEVRMARRVLGDRAPTVDTVFVGGGTPTLLAPDDLGLVLTAIDDAFGLSPDAEVTTEANPDSVDADSLKRLRDKGFTRISFGMQSAVPHVLAALDRTHTAGRPAGRGG